VVHLLPSSVVNRWPIRTTPGARRCASRN
jgi:hypothetical protein